MLTGCYNIAFVLSNKLEHYILWILFSFKRSVLFDPRIFFWEHNFTYLFVYSLMYIFMNLFKFEIESWYVNYAYFQLMIIMLKLQCLRIFTPVNLWQLLRFAIITKQDSRNRRDRLFARKFSRSGVYMYVFQILKHIIYVLFYILYTIFKIQTFTIRLNTCK